MPGAGNRLISAVFIQRVEIGREIRLCCCGRGFWTPLLLCWVIFPFCPLPPPPPPRSITSPPPFSTSPKLARARTYTHASAHIHTHAQARMCTYMHTYALARPLAKWRRKVTKCVAEISYARIILILDFGNEMGSSKISHTVTVCKCQVSK